MAEEGTFLKSQGWSGTLGCVFEICWRFGTLITMAAILSSFPFSYIISRTNLLSIS
jgi:hypothetical protein